MALKKGRPTAFRVRNLSRTTTPGSLVAAIKAQFEPDEQELLVEVKEFNPGCSDGGKTQTTIVIFKPNPPSFLNEDDVLEVDKRDVVFDKHFHGLTQLYPTNGSPHIALEYVLETRCAFERSLIQGLQHCSRYGTEWPCIWFLVGFSSSTQDVASGFSAGGPKELQNDALRVQL